MTWWTTSQGAARQYADLDADGRVERRDSLNLQNPATSDDIRDVLREPGEDVPRDV